MKFVLSYGIWLGAITSYLLLFFMPGHRYTPYANNIIGIYEIVCWFLFAMMLIFNVFILLGKVHKKEIIKDFGEDKQKILFNLVNKKKYYQILIDYIHYAFIAFVAIFVGDKSMTSILVLNFINYYFIKKNIKSFLAESV